MEDSLMNDTILLTGATGFLGTWVARELLKESDCLVLALVRADDQEAAVRRLRRAWWDWPGLAASIGERVQVLCGDVSQPQLGLDDSNYAQLVRQVTHVIHSAADVTLAAPLDDLRAINVRGTEHVLALARAAHRDHGLSRLAHVSTAYVVGGRCGSVPEDDLTDAFGFSSAYEVSKYEAEVLVQAAKSEFPISVFRPGMVVGDSQSGEIKTFNTLYYPLRLYLMGQLPLVPANPDAVVNLVPVDYVARAIVQLTFRSDAAGLNYHLTAPRDSLPTVRELIEFVRQWAREQMDLRLPRPFFAVAPTTRALPHPGGAQTVQRPVGHAQDVAALHG
jgi:long-chain acyl-CoA synthetase